MLKVTKLGCSSAGAQISAQALHPSLAQLPRRRASCQVLLGWGGAPGAQVEGLASKGSDPLLWAPASLRAGLLSCLRFAFSCHCLQSWCQSSPPALRRPCPLFQRQADCGSLRAPRPSCSISSMLPPNPPAAHPQASPWGPALSFPSVFDACLPTPTHILF